MTWFLVDDGLPQQQGVLSIPRAYRKGAIGLWTLAGAWCARNLTDGFVPDYMLEELACDVTDAEWLAKAGIWQQIPGGWQFVVWDPDQLTREQVLDRRAKRAAAGRKGGMASGSTRRGRSNDEASASAPGEALASGGVDESFDAGEPPSRPVPSLPHLLTLVSRLTSSDARATTTDAEVDHWKSLAGTADVQAEARAFLAYNAHTDVKDWRSAWHGWLRKAAQRAGPPPAPPPGCEQCLDGWLPDDDDGRPRPCPNYKPHRKPTPR